MEASACSAGRAHRTKKYIPLVNVVWDVDRDVTSSKSWSPWKGHRAGIAPHGGRRSLGRVEYVNYP